MLDEMNNKLKYCGKLGRWGLQIGDETPIQSSSLSVSCVIFLPPKFLFMYMQRLIYADCHGGKAYMWVPVTKLGQMRIMGHRRRMSKGLAFPILTCSIKAFIGLINGKNVGWLPTLSPLSWWALINKTYPRSFRHIPKLKLKKGWKQLSELHEYRIQNTE